MPSARTKRFIACIDFPAPKDISIFNKPEAFLFPCHLCLTCLALASCHLPRKSIFQICLFCFDCSDGICLEILQSSGALRGRMGDMRGQRSHRGHRSSQNLTVRSSPPAEGTSGIRERSPRVRMSAKSTHKKAQRETCLYRGLFFLMTFYFSWIDILVPHFFKTCSPGCLPSHYITKDDFELRIPQQPTSECWNCKSSGVRGMQSYTWLYVALETGASCTLEKHPTN